MRKQSSVFYTIVVSVCIFGLLVSLTGCPGLMGGDKSTDAEYTVKFNKNGGTGIMQNIKVKWNEMFTLPEPTFKSPAHKQFLGWATDKSLTYAEFKPGDSYMTSCDITFYAIWGDITYIISFLPGESGHYGEMAAQTVSENVKTTLNSCTITPPANQVFDKWVADDGTEYSDQATVTLSGDLTLTARWKYSDSCFITLSFDPNGGEGSMDSVSFNTVTDIMYDLTPDQDIPFTKEHYHFTNWSTDPQSAPNPYAGLGYPTENTTYYAIWEPDTYTIDYYALINGESSYTYHGYNESIYGESLSISKQLYEIPATYKLIGWAVSEDRALSGICDYAPGEYVSPEEDRTLYAVYEQDTVRITCHSNYSSIPGCTLEEEIEVCNVLRGSSFECLENPFSLQENTFFRFWGKNADTLFPEYTADFKETFTEDTDLYAIWGQKCTITFDAGEGNGTAFTLTIDETNYDSVQLPDCPESFTAPLGLSFYKWSFESGTEGTLLNDRPGSKGIFKGDATYKAVWISELVDITYVYGTNTISDYSMSGDTYKTQDQWTFFSYIPDNKYLKGWTVTEGGTSVDYQLSENVIITEDTTLYAVLGNQYTLTVDTNGSTSDNWSRVLKDFETIELSPSFPEITIPVHKQLSCWCTKPDINNSGATTYKQQCKLGPLTADTTIYAIWEYRTLKIPVDANGGSGTMPPVILQDGTRPIAPECTLTPPDIGYDFAGWSFSSTGTSICKPGNELDADSVLFPKTLYAIWKLKTYTYYYDINLEGAGINSLYKKSWTAEDGKQIYLASKTYISSPSGKTFKGWALTPDATEPLYPASSNIAVFSCDPSKSNPEIAATLNSIINGEFSEFTLYGVWDDDHYTVTFVDPDSEQTATQEFTYGVAQKLTTNPFSAPVGTGFYGWSEDKNGTSSAIYKDGVSYTPYKDTTLYAIWKNIYDITLKPEPEDSSKDIALTACFEGQIQKIDAPEDHDGKVFLGWTTDSPTDGSIPTLYTLRGEDITPSSNLTLYGVWAGGTNPVVLKATELENFIKTQTETSDVYIIERSTRFSNLKSALSSTKNQYLVNLHLEYCSEITEIPDEAFKYCERLGKIFLGNNVSSIGESAFSHCINLSEFTIPDSITVIKDYTFSNTKISSIDIPDRITSIGIGAFSSCTQLKEITIPDGITSIKEKTFMDCSQLAEVTITASMTSIGDSAFSNCPISSFDFSHITSIGQYAFSLCKELTSAIMPNITTVSAQTFYGCQKLATVYIPKVTAVESQAFQECSSLTSIDMPEVTYVGYRAFLKSGLTTVSMPKVVTIYNEAFCNLSSVSDFGTLNNLETIGNKAFYGCTQWKSSASLTLPAVTSVGNQAFYNCKFNEITFSASGLTISNEAFRECSSLQSIVLPENVTALGDGAFTGCSDLKSLILPASVTVVPANLCIECNGLEKVTLKGNVTSIGDFAFYSCKKLRSIQTSENAQPDLSTVDIFENGATKYGTVSSHLPSSLESIGESAFNSCKIDTIELPAQLTSLGTGAFENCSLLQTVTYPSGLTVIPENCFKKTMLNSIKIPSGITEIGPGAFSGIGLVNSVYIPASVITVDSTAFEDTKTSSIYYSGTEAAYNALAVSIEYYEKPEYGINFSITYEYEGN